MKLTQETYDNITTILLRLLRDQEVHTVFTKAELQEVLQEVDRIGVY
jgi:hypothetical protein